MDRDIFTFSPEVAEALHNAGAPKVVALESTVISHGLPRPANLQTARRLEQIVRDEGAVPATIAILHGRIHIGLTDDQLAEIAERQDVHKTSTRDLAPVLARALYGATTVAATALIAYRAGIAVFATGGIGGVHRGRGIDVSADLPQLARTPIIVVCSGAKIILDLEATREWLETYGITLVGYKCDEMPAFYLRSSGLPVDLRVDAPEEIAAIYFAHRALKTEQALIVGLPVPEESEAPQEKLTSTLESALREAEEQSVAGHKLTPFLLKRMAEASGGDTLKANIALLENNARLAAILVQTIARMPR